jgi:hypothetical protein
MMLLLIVCILVVAAYGVYLTVTVHKRLAAATGGIETELKEIRSLMTPTKDETPKIPALAPDWFLVDYRWIASDEEKRASIENPAPQKNPDEYLVRMWIAEYQSFPNPSERRDFVRKLIWSGAWINKAEFLDVVYADESPYVRAWAAAHLETVLKDYTKDYSDPKDRPDLRNYETTVLADSVPIVRAALWSNPKCQRLPWSDFGGIAENWKEHFRGLSNLERCGIVRNPELSNLYVVALMETPSVDLNISRVEHSEVLVAAAMNPKLINNSRLCGRESSVLNDFPMEPFEEFGKMWELSVGKWVDQPRVPYFFLKFIQTTPGTKSAMYQVLIRQPPAMSVRIPSSQAAFLRKTLIKSCDPMTDREVLRLAWTDPSEDCRKAAKERVERFTSMEK